MENEPWRMENGIVVKKHEKLGTRHTIINCQLNFNIFGDEFRFFIQNPK